MQVGLRADTVFFMALSIRASKILNTERLVLWLREVSSTWQKSRRPLNGKRLKL